MRQGGKSSGEMADEVLKHRPTAVCMSVMTHSANSAAAIAAVIKATSPSTVVVAGGYHPSGDPEYARTEGIDYVVVGEGEDTIRALLAALESSGDPQGIPGLRFLRNGVVVDTGPAKRITQIDDIPFPLRSMDVLSKARIHGLMCPPPSQQRAVAVVLASRGCPHACSFCCSPSLWGRKVSFRSAQNVVAEIDDLVQRFQTNALFFSDLTFNVSNQRVQELCGHLANYNGMPPWYSMGTTTGLSADALVAMRAGGCRKIGFGVESLSADTLHSLGKGKSCRDDEMHTTLACCDLLGILTKGYLIVGYPWETTASLEQFRKLITSLPIDEIRVSFFTPFPGSAAFEEYQSALLTHDWSKFNAIRDIVIRNQNGLTDEVLKAFRQEVFRVFYGSSGYQSRVQAKVRRHPEMGPAFEELFSFLKAGGVWP